jgi:hypothetical protein
MARRECVRSEASGGCWVGAVSAMGGRAGDGFGMVKGLRSLRCWLMRGLPVRLAYACRVREFERGCHLLPPGPPRCCVCICICTRSGSDRAV